MKLLYYEMMVVYFDLYNLPPMIVSLTRGIITLKFSLERDMKH